MKTLKLAIPAVIALTGLILTSVATYAKPEYAKKEKKSCTFCHVKAGKKELNDAGNYYKQKKSLDGYTEKK